MPELVVEGLVKRFGSIVALDNISFTVQDGEFLTLLGPSGCGKSTTLSIIAGLEEPDSGVIRVGDTVFYNGKDGRFVPPEKRNLGLVFQSYALWPHLTVYENLAFPLKLRKMPKQKERERIFATLKLVELEGLEGRYPHQLSGGQQQRVALARALVYSPSILLLDEPLSNLDAKLRDRARGWLKDLQRRLGITTVYVTHDQIEALALSDRVAVMRSGRIVQIGSPEEIYERPADPFVADFIGTSNFLKGVIASVSDTGRSVVQVDGTDHVLTVDAPGSLEPGMQVTVAVRPERVRIVEGVLPHGVEDNWLPGRIVDRTYLGARYEYRIQFGGFVLRAENGPHFRIGQQVWFSVASDAVVVFRHQEGADS